MGHNDRIDNNSIEVGNIYGYNNPVDRLFCHFRGDDVKFVINMR